VRHAIVCHIIRGTVDTDSSVSGISTKKIGHSTQNSTQQFCRVQYADVWGWGVGQDGHGKKVRESLKPVHQAQIWDKPGKIAGF